VVAALQLASFTVHVLLHLAHHPWFFVKVRLTLVHDARHGKSRWNHSNSMIEWLHSDGSLLRSGIVCGPQIYALAFDSC
jgi:hypothetical protein